MPPFFRKKRRGNSGPNKNQKKVMRGRDTERLVQSVGTLGERFPAVQKLTLQLDFVTPEQQFLDQEIREIGPADPCDFSVPCPGRCGGETPFDFSSKMDAVLRSRQTQAEASGTCRQPLYAGSPDACGLRLQCTIQAEYLPEPDPE